MTVPPHNQTASAGGRSPRRVLFLVFVLITTIILLTLGAWQWQRRAEKAAFLARLEAAQASPPLPYQVSRIWDKVRLTGRYLHEKTLHVHSSQLESGFGVYVMTPFAYPLCGGAQVSCGEAAIIVNRGFVPITPGQAMPAFPKPIGQVTLIGIRRPSEREGMLPPYNSPEKAQYFHRDIRQMAQALELGGLEHQITGDEFVDRLSEAGDALLPKGLAVQTLIGTIPNNHLSYALTWWSLALVNLGVAGFFLFGRRSIPV